MKHYFSTFLSTAILISVSLYFFGGASTYAKLRDHGRETQGLIISLERKKSLEVKYEFIVDGQSYNGTEAEISPEGFKVGNHLKVVYLPEDPNQNSYRDPSVAYANNIVTTVIATLLFAFFITCAAHIRENPAGKRE